MKKWLVIIILLIFVIGGTGYYFLFMKESEPTNNVIDQISNYNYNLEANATKLQKSEFNKLKEILNKEEINESEYAGAVARLFIADLYTINNKLNKYDVGGAVYVFPSSVINYKLNVQDTLYKHLEDNTNGKRNQNLPEVNKVEVISQEETDYKIDDKEYSGYKVSLKWEYVKDIGYDNEGELIVIKSEDYYYIAEKK